MLSRIWLARLEMMPGGYRKLLDASDRCLWAAAYHLAWHRCSPKLPTSREVHSCAREIDARTDHLGSIPTAEQIAVLCEGAGLVLS